MEAPAEPARSFRSLALRGSAWTFAGAGLSQVLRLGGNLLLTRLLFPEAFGLMALVGTFIAMVELFSDVGISPSIVQHRRGAEPAFLNTAWVVQIARGLLVFAVICALALPFAAFYGQPVLAPLLVVSAIGALVASWNSTKLYTARREVAVGRVTGLELVAQVVGLVVMLAWAWQSPSVWALVAGALSASVVKMALTHLALPGVRNRFAWDASAWRSLYTFGRWIFLSTILTFLSFQSDRLIFGALVPLDALGLYFVGSTLASIPLQLLGRLEQSVIFPLYSRVLNQGRRLEPVFHPTRQLLVLGSGGVFAVLAAAGGPIVELLYDPRYLAAAPFLQILAAGAWLRILVAGNGMALLAHARPEWVAAANGAKLVALAAGVALGWKLGGFVGAVAGFAASELASYAVLAFAAAGIGLSSWRKDAVSACSFALAVSLGLWTCAALQPAWGALVVLAGATLVTSAVWLSLAALRSRELVLALRRGVTSASD